MQNWQSIGSHQFYTETDIVFWRMIGVMDGVHIERLLEEVDATLARFHRSVLLVDCAHAQILTVEARRSYAEWLKHKPEPHRASIFFSVSGEMQTFLLLAQRSGQLLSGQRSAIEIVEDEAAAHRRVEVLRTEWRQSR